MSPNSESPDQPRYERINELYWHSDRTIAEITGEVDVSRNALYTAIRPVAAGATCTECGERLVYTNRTRRDTGLASCRACGAEADLQAAPVEHSAPARAFATDAGGQRNGRDETDSWDANRGDASWSRWREDLASVEPERYALVGSAAALGVMLGAAAARALRDRV